ncbi:MAG: UDP-N-acetylmuramoyl-L-alanine--D-glutamate ligase [Bacteroidetes bacterium]|nr:UDP-N-acetylmuramoyl-L-alanine--D-glutamate ligase [Bacteroidota bacterium]
MSRKNIIVLGAGESGVGAAILAKKKGFDVFVSDLGKIKEKYKNVLLHHEINFEEGKHTESIILQADEVIKSPGIPDNASIIKAIENKGIPVIDELEFAARYTNATKVCITGSNGKTTTTLLTYHILKNAGFNVGLGGNVGQSFAQQVAENNFDYYVLEVSSFQLDRMFNFKAEIAILTNITPDHLDRYNYQFENYIRSKFRITQNQTAEDIFIFCADDDETMKHIYNYQIAAKKYSISLLKTISDNGAYLENKNIILTTNTKKITMELETLALQGRHNIYNSMAASVASKILNVRKSIIKNSLSNFDNIEHRLEFIAKVHGIEFINDSKATNVNSTWYALECMTKPTIWIVGGQDKGNDYSTLKLLVKSKVKAIVCLGIENSKIIQEFSGIVPVIVETKSAKEAVDTAYLLAESDDVVLLSPCCSSFDLFENFEDRGIQFKNAVNEL